MDLKMFGRQPISQWRTGGLMWGSHNGELRKCGPTWLSLLLANFSLLVLSVLIAPNFFRRLNVCNSQVKRFVFYSLPIDDCPKVFFFNVMAFNFCSLVKGFCFLNLNN